MMIVISSRLIMDVDGYALVIERRKEVGQWYDSSDRKFTAEF